jgi:hypothetical protein
MMFLLSEKGRKAYPRRSTSSRDETCCAIEAQRISGVASTKMM